MKTSIALLVSFSLVKRTRYDSFTIHPVVHTWARERLQISEKEEIIQKILEILNRATSLDSIRRESPEWDSVLERRIFIHVDHFSQLLKIQLGTNMSPTSLFDKFDKEKLAAIYGIGMVFGNQGRYDDALEWYE